MRDSITKLLLAVALIVGTQTIIRAHGSNSDHTHQKSELHKASIKNIARLEVKRYVMAKKLDRSWNSVSVNKIEKKEFNKQPEWVVTFHNLKEQNHKREMLYIFVDLYGEITGANFTGE